MGLNEAKMMVIELKVVIKTKIILNRYKLHVINEQIKRKKCNE